MDSILFEQNDTLGYLTLNRPDQRNALSLALMQELQAQLNQIEKNKEIKVLIIKGNGPAFCSGHDLKELMQHKNDLHYYRNIFSICSEMMQTLHHLPQPVIAQVHGVATAAGCQLVAACDLAIAETQAQFATPGVKIGLFCSTPMVPLSRVIGRRRALEMLLTGEFISADEAKHYGLVNKVVPFDHLDEEVKRFAERIAQYSLFTLGFGKKMFYHQIDQDETTAYRCATEAMAMNSLAFDAQEGITAAIEKRKPVWKDR